MSLEATRLAITTALETAINSNGYSGEKIEWPNHRLGQQPAEARWWRISILTGQTNPVTVGGVGQRRTRTPFVVTIQLFLPEKSGTRAAYQIATKLALGTSGLNYLQATKTDTTTTPNQRCYCFFETLGIEPVGITEGHYQFNLQISGRADCQDSA